MQAKHCNICNNDSITSFNNQLRIFMKKIQYNVVRFSDGELFKKAKIRAVKEKISLMELIQKSVKDYLKTGIDI